VPGLIDRAEPAFADEPLDLIAIEHSTDELESLSRGAFHAGPSVAAILSACRSLTGAPSFQDDGVLDDAVLNNGAFVNEKRIEDRTTLAQEVPSLGTRAGLVIYFRDGVKVVPLVEDTPVIVGRAWPADVVVPDLSLSRQHARIVLSGDRVHVEDLGSTNGTKVRGELIKDAHVEPGEPIVLGSVTASVNVTGAEAQLRGIIAHQRFLDRLDEEVVRARVVRRAFALIMIRAATVNEGHLSTWVPRVRADLRDLDLVALYGPSSVVILMPEVEREVAVGAAYRLVQPRLGEPTLLAGVAMFPESASSDELLDVARRAVRRATSSVPVQAANAPDGELARPVVASAAMQHVYALVARVAQSSIPILINGETGTGKEVIARAIHDSSARRANPMRSINCGAIPGTLVESVLFGHERGAFTGADRAAPGIFEQAQGGTVFLDEVGELAAGAQAALLRVLETKRVTRVGGTSEVEVDVRVVAATHRDLEAMVSGGTFRQDLFYRLNAMTLTVPPLRERPEEIDLLADRFLEEAKRETGAPITGFDDSARALLRTYEWPGNVRELRNVIERAVLVSSGPKVVADDLGERLRATEALVPEMAGVSDDASLEFKERVKQYEIQLILDALRRAEGNQTQAARLLKMPLRTLVHKIKMYGIKKQWEV
jgi:DNA-binding NtrC family response regulator